MPENLKSKAALCLDNGLFVSFAERLARDFGQIFYFSPWANAYPRAAADHIGHGLPGVKRVSNFWDVLSEVDIVVVPDLYFAGEVRVLREKFGLPVWAHGYAESLELDRWGTREMQERLGLPAPKTEFITGLDDLEKYLRDPEHKDKWVKLSTYRGDAETFHHETWHTSSIWLDWLRNRVGALAGRYEFLVEEAINDAIEIGYDGYTVRGEFPSAAYFGIEVKDKGYIGVFRDYDDHPEPVRTINEKMSKILKKEESSGFLSFEYRWAKDGTAYLIDPCLRCGSPPIEGTQEAYRNLSEFIWAGAHGEMVDPVPVGKYCAMAMMHSNFALTNWVPVEIPPDVVRWVKLRNCAVIRGKRYFVPGVAGEMPEIGAVVAVSDDLDDAIRQVKERAEKVKAYGLDIFTDALDSAQEEIARAEEYGVRF